MSSVGKIDISIEEHALPNIAVKCSPLLTCIREAQFRFVPSRPINLTKILWFLSTFSAKSGISLKIVTSPYIVSNVLSSHNSVTACCKIWGSFNKPRADKIFILLYHGSVVYWVASCVILRSLVINSPQLCVQISLFGYTMGFPVRCRLRLPSFGFYTGSHSGRRSYSVLSWFWSVPCVFIHFRKKFWHLKEVYTNQTCATLVSEFLNFPNSVCC